MDLKSYSETINLPKGAKFLTRFNDNEEWTDLFKEFGINRFAVDYLQAFDLFQDKAIKHGDRIATGFRVEYLAPEPIDFAPLAEKIKEKFSYIP